MHAADEAERHGRREVGGEQERIVASDQSPAGAWLSRRKTAWELVAFLLRQQLDERHVADLIEADQHRVIELAVGQTKRITLPQATMTWKFV